MKVLATFDGSALSEATLPQLTMIARLPTSEFVLVGVAASVKDSFQHVIEPAQAASGEISQTMPSVVGAPADTQLETKSQAIERKQAEIEDYLRQISARLGVQERTKINACVGQNPADAIIETAQKYKSDVIVMATRGKTGIRHALFGSTTEKVVRSGVAPVLIVHPVD